jgi:aspartate/glutamate racemase
LTVDVNRRLRSPRIVPDFRPKSRKCYGDVSTATGVIHRKYIGELLKNEFLPGTRAEILNIAQRMKAEDSVEAIVLAGTELPLLLRGFSLPDLDFLDTAAIHVEAIR